MKKIIILFLLIYNINIAQKISFAVISSPKIDKKGNTVQLDSTISKLNQNKNIDFVIISGNLTDSGSEKEFLILKSSLNKLEKPYYLLHSNNDVLDANGWIYYMENFDDKIYLRYGNKIFIGLSSLIPLTTIKHYTVENINWLNETLDTLNLSDEIYFLSPLQIDNEVDNWKNIIKTLTKRNLKLLININSRTTELRNLFGYSVLDWHPDQNSKILDYITIEITNNSIKIFNQDKKIVALIDKTIELPKDKIESDSIGTYASNILLNTSLNTTMLTSCIFWNNRIYTSDYLGLITCIDTTGKILWEYDCNGNILGKPFISDRILTAATFQGDLITLSAVSGEQIQSIGFDDFITTDLLAIDYSGEKELMIPKLTESKTAIVFGTSSGKIYCYDLETLQEYWVNDYCKDMITSKLIYIDNKIFYTSRDGYLYCVDARNGITIWRWKEKPTISLSYSNILSDGKRIFVVSIDGTLYAINLLLGKLDWKIENSQIFQNIGLSNNKKFVYALNLGKEFLIITSDKGKLERIIKTDIGLINSFSPSQEIDDRIFICNDGMIYYLDTKNNFTKCLYTGKSYIHPIEKISQNKFLLSNIDGTIIIFKLR